MRILSIPNDLKEYSGHKIEQKLSEPQRTAFCENWRQMQANYLQNVDSQLLQHQILLCEETIEKLYSGEWQRADYVKGSRPELEKIVNQLTEDKSSVKEKVLSIMCFCRDLYKKNDGILLFYGGTEEELIKKGEQLCECLARLMVALCEIIDIPGRIITHIAGGHLTCEVFLENKWSYFDPRTGIFYVLPNGQIASAIELLLQPEIMDRQPEWVKKHVSTRWTWEERNKKCKEKFFSTSEVNTVKPYSLSDSALYNYEWTTKRDFVKNGVNEISKAYQEGSAKCFGNDFIPKPPGFLLTIADNQVITKPIKVVAIANDFVIPPSRVRFLIDGKIVWETEKFIPPDVIHSYCEGNYSLFGCNGLFDPNNFDEGPHIIKVHDIENRDVSSKVCVIVKHQ